jgi:hypothetical protein
MHTIQSWSINSSFTKFFYFFLFYKHSTVKPKPHRAAIYLAKGDHCHLATAWKTLIYNLNRIQSHTVGFEVILARTIPWNRKEADFQQQLLKAICW